MSEENSVRFLYVKVPLGAVVEYSLETLVMGVLGVCTGQALSAQKPSILYTLSIML